VRKRGLAGAALVADDADDFGHIASLPRIIPGRMEFQYGELRGKLPAFLRKGIYIL
jgi:hypothetical protein